MRTQNADLAARLGSLTTAREALKADYTPLRHQLDWFKRQLFGRRSEKHIPFESGAALVPVEEISYWRRKKQRGNAASETGLRFDESVSVTTIEVRDPAVEAIPDEERQRIGEKVTHRPAQRPASYQVSRYVRPVVKRRNTGEMVTARAVDRTGAHRGGRERARRDAGGQVQLPRAAKRRANGDLDARPGSSYAP